MATDGPEQMGGALKADFPFDPEWTNLNHGSYGASPKVIHAKRREYQDECERRPDPFIKGTHFKYLDESRDAVAKLINAPPQTVVFVNNATEGVNTVLRNLVWNPDGKDVIISFSTIYDACARAEDFLVDYFEGKVAVHDVDLEYPLEDEEIIALFKDAVKSIEAEGKRARVCLFDVVSSNPGVLFPWHAMTQACHELGVLSLIDGAQGIGMVPIDISAVNPDFFVSNCHKWLHVPRGCAVFHVPERNHHLVPTSLATGRGYLPKKTDRVGRTQPLPDADGKSHFARNFEWIGTRDDSALFCVKDSIAWRRDVLGGEDRIISYLWDLNKKGIQHVASVLGTEVIDNKQSTLTNCGMGNAGLPIWVGDKGKEKAKEGEAVLTTEEAQDAFNWMTKTMFEEYKTHIVIYVRWDRFWTRVSAQVYLDMKDYEFAGRVLKELCERVGKGEFRQ